MENNSNPKPAPSRTALERILLRLGLAQPAGETGIILRIKKLIVTLAALGCIGFLAGFAGLYEYSTSPHFCNNCHIMTPYYQAWKTSSHNFVPCVSCHYPPGTKKLWVKFQAISQVVKYVTRTYSSKPFAEIEDASCLREGCHSKRLLQGKVLTRAGVRFDHTPHLQNLRRGKQLRCTSCHSQIVIGSHIEVTYSTCFLCHFKAPIEGGGQRPPAGCLSCHPVPEQDIKLGDLTFNHRDFIGQPGNKCENCHQGVTRGTGEAPQDRCFTCHNQPDRLARYTDIEFMHQNHVSKHKIECTQCHFRIEHGLSQATLPGAAPTQCSTCHQDQHLGPAEMYRGQGGRGGVKSRPSPMFLAHVDCVGCHVKPEATGLAAELMGQTFKASEQGCVTCHGQDYQGILPGWQQSLQKATAAVQAKLDRVQQRLRGLGPGAQGVKTCQDSLPDATFNLSFVRLARGVHNPDYADDLLHQAGQVFDQCLQTLGPGKSAAAAPAPVQGKSGN